MGLMRIKSRIQVGMITNRFKNRVVIGNIHLILLVKFTKSMRQTRTVDHLVVAWSDSSLLQCFI
jgi:hypothetical protein